MKNEHVSEADLEWMCESCGCHLVAGPATVEYLGNEFTTDLAKCPKCSLVLISEEIAMGKMAEVEQILEDK